MKCQEQRSITALRVSYLLYEHSPYPAYPSSSERTRRMCFFSSKFSVKKKLVSTSLESFPEFPSPNALTLSLFAKTLPPYTFGSRLPPIWICAKSFICCHCFSAAYATALGQCLSPLGRLGGGALVLQNGSHRGTAWSLAYMPSGTGGNPGSGGNGAGGSEGNIGTGGRTSLCHVPLGSMLDIPWEETVDPSVPVPGKKPEGGGSRTDSVPVPVPVSGSVYGGDGGDGGGGGGGGGGFTGFPYSAGGGINTGLNGGHVNVASGSAGVAGVEGGETVLSGGTDAVGGNVMLDGGSTPVVPPTPGGPVCFCSTHTFCSSKSKQQSPTARQSESQQHDARHKPHAATHEAPDGFVISF